MHAVILDLPRNTCQIAEISNSEQDRLYLQHIMHFEELLSRLMDLDSQGHMFCPALQFKSLHQLSKG